MAKKIGPDKRSKRIRTYLNRVQDELRAAVDEGLIVSIHDDDGDVIYRCHPDMRANHSIEFGMRVGRIVYEDDEPDNE